MESKIDTSSPCPHLVESSSDGEWHDVQTRMLYTRDHDWMEVLDESSSELLDRLDWFDFRNLCLICAEQKVYQDHGIRLPWLRRGMSFEEQAKWQDFEDLAFSCWDIFTKNGTSPRGIVISRESLMSLAKSGVTSEVIQKWSKNFDDLDNWTDEIISWFHWGVSDPDMYWDEDGSTFESDLTLEIGNPPPIELRTVFGLTLTDIGQWNDISGPEMDDNYQLLFAFLKSGVLIKQALTVRSDFLELEAVNEDGNIDLDVLTSTLKALKDVGLPVDVANLNKWWDLGVVDILELIDSGLTDEVHVLLKRFKISEEDSELFSTLFSDSDLEAEDVCELIDRGLTSELDTWLDSADAWALLWRCLRQVEDFTVANFREFYEAGFLGSENVGECIRTIRSWRVQGIGAVEAAQWRDMNFESWEVSPWRFLGLSPDIAAKRRDAGIVPRVPTSALEVFPDWDYESEETPTPEDRFSKALPSRRYSSEEVSELLTLLRPFEASVITFRFALDGADSPRTLEEVAGALGLERERIRQLEASGFEKLRKYLLIE